MFEYYDFIGAVIVVFAFGLLATDMVGKCSYLYIFLNIIGSGIMLFKAFTCNAIGIASLQATWIVVSFVLLFLRFIHGSAFKVDDDAKEQIKDTRTEDNRRQISKTTHNDVGARSGRDLGRARTTAQVVAIRKARR